MNELFDINLRENFAFQNLITVGCFFTISPNCLRLTMAYGSSVSRVPERDYIQSLSNFILSEGILQIPPNQTNHDFWGHQAATLLREYYIHPSIRRPFYKKERVKTTEQIRKAFEKYVNNKCFEMLMSLNWIRQDSHSNLFLITDEARIQMDQIANQLFDKSQNDLLKDENSNPQQ